MILVTLGTHPRPMDRVVVALDDLIEHGIVTEPVIVQAAAFRVRPRLARAVSVVDYDQLEAWIREARIVICHGGPGTILQVQAAGKIPRVIPRDPRLGEHVDSHQQRFVRWLASRRPIVPIWDIGELVEALRDRELPGQETAAPDPEAARRLIEVVEAWAAAE